MFKVDEADDLTLLGQIEMKAMVEVLDVEGKKFGFRNSRQKTEYFHMRRYRKTREEKDLHVEDTISKV